MVDTLAPTIVTATRIYGPRPAQPNDYRPVAVPQCIVEIYPYEGGQYTFQGKGLLRCNVERNIRGDRGTFKIDLPPGGSGGPNSTPSWSEIITPNSLVLIGMARGTYRAVTMIGVVRVTVESQRWPVNHPVQRGTHIEGEDFSYFFNSFSWMTLYFLGSSAGAALNEANSSLGLPAILGDGYTTGTPSGLATNWFTGLMGGTEGILAKTTFFYQNQPVTFPEAIAYLFEPYDFTIPFGTTFIQSEGSWAAKFADMLPFPFYELFIITAPSDWPLASLASTGGIEFTIPALGSSVASTPVVVGRLNPLPFVDITVSGQNITFNEMDTQAWNQLPNYVADVAFRSSDLFFPTDEVRNFFIINPTWFRTLFGQSNSQLTSFIYSFGGVADTDSIHRFGYRPLIQETSWFSDISGNYAQGSSVNVFNSVAKLIARLFSYYGPTALMARATVVYPYRPDIFPGSTFTYNPFKGEGSWTFYIEGVGHDFDFGGDAVTTLSLSRGLPSEIYADESGDGLLMGIHMGTVQRINGIYTKNPNLKGIQAFGQSPAAVMNVLGEIAQVYKTPQTR